MRLYCSPVRLLLIAMLSPIFFMGPVAYADVQVVDETTEIGIPHSQQSQTVSEAPEQDESIEVSSGTSVASSAKTLTTSHMSLEQRLARLEQQQTATQNLALLNKINELQTQVRQQQGQIEVLQHDLQESKDQQRKQYVDLDSRLNKSKPNVTPIPNSARAFDKTNDKTSEKMDVKSVDKTANKKVSPLDPGTPANFTGNRREL